MKNYFYWLLRALELLALFMLTFLLIKLGFYLLSQKNSLANVGGAFTVLFTFLSAIFYCGWFMKRVFKHCFKDDPINPDKSC